jgi:hypothetical protein
MALSIEFGIARTYAVGVCLYVVCAVTLVGIRQADPMGVSAARRVKQPRSVRPDEVAAATAPAAPSTQRLRWLRNRLDV